MLVILLVACNGETHDSVDEEEQASRAARSPDTVDTESLEPAPVDLPEGLTLGADVRTVRPPLTAGCQAHHYAERLGERHLALRCMTSTPAADGTHNPRDHFIEVGFREYDDASPRLAYYIDELDVPRHAGPTTWLGALVELRVRVGIPGLALEPGRAAWSGRARDGEPSTIELRLISRDARAVVRTEYRHRTLSDSLY